MAKKSRPRDTLNAAGTVPERWQGPVPPAEGTLMLAGDRRSRPSEGRAEPEPAQPQRGLPPLLHGASDGFDISLVYYVTPIRDRTQNLGRLCIVTPAMSPDPNRRWHS